MFLSDKDTRRFTDLYNEYYAVIFSAAYSKIKNIDTARDLTQEVFTRFFMKMNEMDETGNYRRWFLSTLKFVILEYYKSNSGTVVDISDLSDDLSLSFVNGFLDSRIIMEEALENMANFGDDKGRVIFDLVTVYHYTYKEVSAQLGITERQVRYRYTQIVNNLVDYFKSKGIKGLDDLL